MYGVYWIALLHAINLGKLRQVPMPQLRSLLERLGYSDVQTYIQSGNVLFSMPEARENQLKEQLEAALESEFGFAVPVTLRPAADWPEIVDNCPPELLTEKVYAGLLGENPEERAVAKLRELEVSPERWAIVGRTLYQTVPEGVKNLKLSHARIERVLGISCTVRNWRTVEALSVLSAKALAREKPLETLP